MSVIGIFPFGQPVQELIQTDRTPKRVFVLGVYASAVHARWVSANNKTLVNALAVASEPYIFWRGEDPEKIIRKIIVPPELGKLIPANRQYNGPSGIALDCLILNPLGLGRDDAWLCDLVPHSCVNQAQAEAIRRKYERVAAEYGLPKPTVPPKPAALSDEKRRQAILDELRESKAGTLILLGDQPIQWFLSYFDPRWKRLADFMREGQPYGEPVTTEIDGAKIKLLPLAHPRQIAKLGSHSPRWYDQHQLWKAKCERGEISLKSAG